MIDHDESTYLEIARMILGGKTLYIDMIDIKPPGIFLILAGFQALFGYSIFIIRLLVALWIAITALIIFKTNQLLVKDEKASFASGIIYILFISTWSFYGISITPEIFFNLFTILALYMLLKKQSFYNYLCAGLIAGLGFIVKYLVIFDFAGIMAFMVFLGFYHKKKLNFSRATFSLILFGLGFFLPFILINLWYYLNGDFDALYNIVYLAPSRYPSAFDPWKMLKFILDFHIRFLPVFFFFYFVLISSKFRSAEILMAKKLWIIWSVMALVGVMIAGKTFGHYTIQLMLPVSLVAGVYFHSEMTGSVYISRLLSGKGGRIMMAGLIFILAMMKIEYVIQKDVPREITAYLQPRLKAGDIIYTGNYHHILYYLIKKDSPTKYIHRSLLYRETHIKALDIHVDEEFRKIIAQKPLYIITEEEFPAGMMKDFIQENYYVEKEFGEGVLLNKLKKW